jgi:hypothetical protein
VASATATGTIGEPLVEQTSADSTAYCVHLPVDLELVVTLSGSHHHYTAEADIEIRIAARLEPPLSICIEPTPPTHRDVTVKVHPKGLQAKVVGRMGDIDSELRREIAEYVTDRITTDAAQYTNVDLRPIIHAAWPTA